MNNQTLIGLTGLVIACVFTLLYMNFKQHLSFENPFPLEKSGELEKSVESNALLSYNDVQSIAIVHEDKFYLLNFEQQNAFIGILNESQPISEEASVTQMTLNFTKIFVYPFNASVIEITPFAYTSNNLVFSSPSWNKSVLRQENSQGTLKKLLSETFDP